MNLLSILILCVSCVFVVECSESPYKRSQEPIQVINIPARLHRSLMKSAVRQAAVGSEEFVPPMPSFEEGSYRRGGMERGWRSDTPSFSYSMPQARNDDSEETDDKDLDNEDSSGENSRIANDFRSDYDNDDEGDESDNVPRSDRYSTGEYSGDYQSEYENEPEGGEGYKEARDDEDLDDDENMDDDSDSEQLQVNRGRYPRHRRP